MRQRNAVKASFKRSENNKRNIVFIKRERRDKGSESKKIDKMEINEALCSKSFGLGGGNCIFIVKIKEA